MTGGKQNKPFKHTMNVHIKNKLQMTVYTRVEGNKMGGVQRVSKPRACRQRWKYISIQA